MISTDTRALSPAALEAVASFGTVAEKHPNPEAFSEAFKRHVAHVRDTLNLDPANLCDVRCACSSSGIGFLLRFAPETVTTWERLS